MKKISIVLGMLLSITSLVSCGTAPSGGEPEPAGVKELTIFYPRDQKTIIEEFVNNYKRGKTFDFEIKTQRIDGNTYVEDLRLKISQGCLDSWLIFGNDNVSLFGNKIYNDFFVDFNELIDEELINGLNSNLISNFTYNDKLLSLPICWGTNALAYDKSYLPELYPTDLESKLASYSNVENLFNDINLSWRERVEVSVYRLFEIVQDYLYNNNIDLPSVDNKTNVESVKQLLEYWKEMLGEYVLITTTDKMPGAGISFPACFMSYKFVNQPSEESDFLFSTFGNAHTGMAKCITYMQDTSVNHRHDAIDDFVSGLCSSMISSNYFMREYIPWWPTAKQSLLNDSEYVESVVNASDFATKLTSQLFDQNIVNKLKIDFDPIKRVKSDAFCDGVKAMMMNRLSTTSAARQVISTINLKLK